MRSGVPSIDSSVVITIRAPSASLDAVVPDLAVRIFGPDRSCSSAIALPSASRSPERLHDREVLSCVPCEKFNRTR